MFNYIRSKMASKAVNAVNVLKKKFRGVYMGILMGDCLGAPFENDHYMSSAKLTTQNYFNAMNQNQKLPYKTYTQNFAMTKVLTNCILENDQIDCKELAKKMTLEYYTEDNRKYDQNLQNIFDRWSHTAFEGDLYAPAEENKCQEGCVAVTITPIALSCRDTKELIWKIKKTTSLTHSDKIAKMGAVLQALAIQTALDLGTQWNTQQFLLELQSKLSDCSKNEIVVKYLEQLYIINELLKYKFSCQHEQDTAVVNLLGNSSNALQAIPMAIYCFLRSQKKIDRIKADNNTIASIQYAISLGGATNLTASLVGALSGAYFTENAFENNLKKYIEKPEEAYLLSDKLYEAFTKKYNLESE